MMIIAAKQFNMTPCPLTSMVPKLCRNIHVQLELNLPAVHSGPFLLFWLVVTTTVLDPLPNHTKQKSWLNNSLADRQTPLRHMRKVNTNNNTAHYGGGTGLLIWFDFSCSAKLHTCFLWGTVIVNAGNTAVAVPAVGPTPTSALQLQLLWTKLQREDRRTPCIVGRKVNVVVGQWQWSGEQ